MLATPRQVTLTACADLSASGTESVEILIIHG